MTKRQRLLTAAIAGAFGLGLCATSSFASGPMILGPAPVPLTVPKMHMTNTVTPVKVQLLNAYRQVRAFWISRAIVR